MGPDPEDRRPPSPAHAVLSRARPPSGLSPAGKPVLSRDSSPRQRCRATLSGPRSGSEGHAVPGQAEGEPPEGVELRRPGGAPAPCSRRCWNPRCPPFSTGLMTAAHCFPDW